MDGGGCHKRFLQAALEFVAAKGYVHMDVAARNVLLHTNNLVKLADFGITRPVDPTTGMFRQVATVFPLSGSFRSDLIS
jgi:serine/threonine protein kinase